MWMSMGPAGWAALQVCITASSLIVLGPAHSWTGMSGPPEAAVVVVVVGCHKQDGGKG